MEVRQTLGGRYKLLDELGSGGMAVVWRARDQVLGRPVAVKLLAGRYVGDPQSRARILDEARAAATLSHPNIAQVYDYGEADEDGTPVPYVVMELVNGPTLQQRVAAGPMPPRTVFRICGEVAAALAAAHLDGLVHRDIKMANIMVTAAGAKVVDFGIAAVAGPAAPEEMLVGTPAYLAPERLTGDAIVPASDVYALGVLLYRLLTKESPWSVETTTQMLRAHIYVEPEPLPPLPGVPPAVAELIARCLRKDPGSRPSASEVSSTLADAVEASSVATPVRGASATPPRVPRPADGRADALDERTSARSRSRRSAAGGVVGGAGGVVGGAASGLAGGGAPGGSAGGGAANGLAGGGGRSAAAASGGAGGGGRRGGLTGSDEPSRAADAGPDAASAAAASTAASTAASAAADGGQAGDGRRDGNVGLGREAWRAGNDRGIGSGARAGGAGTNQRAVGGQRRGAGAGTSSSGSDPRDPREGKSPAAAETRPFAAAGADDPAGAEGLAGTEGVPGAERVADAEGLGGPARRADVEGPAGAESRAGVEGLGGPARRGGVEGPSREGRRARAEGLAGAESRAGVDRRAGVEGRPGAESLAGLTGRTGVEGRMPGARQSGARAPGGQRAGAAGRDVSPGGGLFGRRGRRGVYGSKHERKVVVIAGTLAVVIAAVAGWFLADSSGTTEAERGKPGTATAAPAASGLPEAPPVTGASGQPLPAATDLPVRPPIAGSGPTATTGPGDGPAQASPSATGDSPGDGDSPKASTPPPEGKRLTSPGGVVRATCAKGKATLTSWEPAAGYSVEKVEPGPSLAPVIVFKGTPNRYRMTVTCVAGTPTPVVLPL